MPFKIRTHSLMCKKIWGLAILRKIFQLSKCAANWLYCFDHLDTVEVICYCPHHTSEILSLSLAKYPWKQPNLCMLSFLFIYKSYLKKYVLANRKYHSCIEFINRFSKKKVQEREQITLLCSKTDPWVKLLKSGILNSKQITILTAFIFTPF